VAPSGVRGATAAGTTISRSTTAVAATLCRSVGIIAMVILQKLRCPSI
jgi:hypothetical protein